MSPSFVFCEYCKTDLVTCENDNFKGNMYMHVIYMVSHTLTTYIHDLCRYSHSFIVIPPTMLFSPSFHILM